MSAEVCIVLVNWHAAHDTIQCLQSLASMDTPTGPVHVIVVDNASTDDSLDRIAGHLHERGFAPTAAPSVATAIETGTRIAGIQEFSAKGTPLTSVILVASRTNLGFAGGNNIGIELARKHLDATFVWLLNNDTEVRTDTLRRLVARMRAQPDLGMLGCTIVFHDRPEIIQCSGGVHYSTLTGRGWLFAAGRALAQGPTNAEAEARLDYVNGASMFTRGTAIDAVGPLAEHYFLYNEEIDWAWRARGRYSLGVEVTAVVAHKEGATIGTGTQRQKASPLANFYQTRSKLLFARRFTPWFLPSVWLVLFARFIKQWLGGGAADSLIILQVLLGRRKPDPAWFRPRLATPVSTDKSIDSSTGT